MLSSVTMQSISKAEIKDLLSHAFKTQYRVQDHDKKVSLTGQMLPSSIVFIDHEEGMKDHEIRLKNGT